MKNFILILATSLISAFVAIAVYRTVEEPKTVLIRETIPAKYINTTAEPNVLVPARKIPAPKKTTNNFTDAAAYVTPAVVNIKATEESDYFWRSNGYASSSGSGVIVSEDGYIVTNQHVIEDGSTIEVTLNDKREFKAKLIGSDPSTDLALLKIDATELPSVFFGNSDSVMVGEWVMAVGNPFNLESTVTAGIISAKGRNIDILDDQYSIESFIQTDAAVNPGNSGGALVNTKGELIGINTAIITRSGRYEGYSFAVPSNLVNKIINDLREFGQVQRAILGVSIENVDDKRAKSLDLPSVGGVYIGRVNPNGGADEAGLKSGDVIVGIDDSPVKSIPELQEIIGRNRPGDIVNVQYYRKGKLISANVVLKNKNNTMEYVEYNQDNMLLELGFELRNLNSKELSRLQVEGIKVLSIYRGSTIERTKMDPGYIITKINDKQVKNLDEFVAELDSVKGRIMLEGFYENFPGEYYYTFNK